MKNTLLLCYLLLITQLSVQAQDISIPDANFKAALLSLGIDTNTDTKIQVSEAEAIHYLNVAGKHIEDVTGIEYFINLDTLILNENLLTSLDVTKNVKLIALMFAYNHIRTIDLNQNTKLKYLLCPLTSLTALELSNCPLLEELYCHQTSLTTLDISANTNLLKLECEETSIQSLDLSANIYLKELDCRKTQIASLDLTNNAALERLQCTDLSISSLDITKNAALVFVNCSNNENLTQICITTDQLASTPNWQKDNTATWSTNCQLSTPIQDAATTTAAKVVYKVHTITGAEIDESNATDGIYIYLYTDGSRTKLAK